MCSRNFNLFVALFARFGDAIDTRVLASAPIVKRFAPWNYKQHSTDRQVRI